MGSWVKHGTMGEQLKPSEGGDAAKPICWLYGAFGCGKSAIAQTMAVEFEGQERLAAAFFFFRNAGDRSDLSRFANTLAHQIGLSVPGAKELIERAIDENPGLLEATCDLQVRLRYLVFEPMRRCMAGDDAWLMIIDGLDECVDKEGISLLIDLFIAFFSRNPDVPLRLLITSRVEQHIQARVHRGKEAIHLVNLSKQTTDTDIRCFMDTFFAEVREDDAALRTLHKTWPSDKAIEWLVKHCNGSFIFASTLAKFIIGGTGDRDPRTLMERLPLALEINPGIDGVYTEILSRAQHLSHFQTVISTIAYLERPLSISAISALLGLSTYDVLCVLIPLQSILQVPGCDDAPATVFHTSVRNFLTDESRSGNLHSPPSHHVFLFHRCMDLFIGAEPTTNNEANMYAMVYWLVHLRIAKSKGCMEEMRDRNHPYRPIDLCAWKRRNFKSSRGEGRPVTIALPIRGWRSLVANLEELGCSSAVSANGYPSQDPFPHIHLADELFFCTRCSLASSQIVVGP